MDSQSYTTSNMNDTLHIGVEVSVPEKSHKYKRFAHEKRTKRTSGKKMQTQEIMVTKWDVEIARNKGKKVGRNRDRAIKYGMWDEHRTDTASEDAVNTKIREQASLRATEKVILERRRQTIRRSLAELAELLFPTFSLTDRGGWSCDAWESYHEYLEYSSTARAREREYQSMFREQHCSK
jgi:hypothetical protein